MSSSTAARPHLLTPNPSLNLRTTINIYRQLGQFIEAADAEARARGEAEDATIDPHFRSGVCLGVGMSNVILSLMPSKVLTIIELFGYKGDRHAGLAYLMKPGGWSKDEPEPAVGVGMFGSPLYRGWDVSHVPRGGRPPETHMRHGASALPSRVLELDF